MMLNIPIEAELVERFTIAAMKSLPGPPKG
jgi:hypothetical protein